MADKLTKWGEESIQVQVKTPDALRDEPENQKVIEACDSRFGEVRMRLMWGFYGPGTTDKPRPRYWWAIGESATVICKNPDVANWFREQLKEWLCGMDGVILEVKEPE